MKKQKVGWAIVIAALGMAIMATSAVADITYSVGGVGDALIFPYFDADKENIVCISNESPNWIQVHVRLRTGYRSVEGRDFPLILSPGDVSVFVITRNGYSDGLWRVEWKDLDPDSFEYVRTRTSPSVARLTEMQDPVTGEVGAIINRFELLEPGSSCVTTGKWSTESKEFDKQYGYIEVIGEAIFVCDAFGNCGANALNHTSLLLPNGCTNTQHFVNTGGTLDDVPNVLYGKMYILDADTGTGVAYNATALSHFRTNADEASNGNEIRHRVENYVVPGVILSSENAAINNSVADDYTYRYEDDKVRGTLGGDYESMVSANNSWGSTLAEGDDYLDDLLDVGWGVPTSVREVELAIRRPSVRGHYFNNFNYFGSEGFLTHVVITLPTKHHIAESRDAWLATTSWEAWKCRYSELATSLQVEYTPELWDIYENTITASIPFDISPLPPTTELTYKILSELAILTPGSSTTYNNGRFVLSGFSDGGRGLVQGGTIPCIGLNFVEATNGDIGYMTGTHY